MKWYPIFINYDPTVLPIGRVELDVDRIPEELYPDIAIVPALLKGSTDTRFRIVDFGLIQRTHVDTRPREL